MWFVSESGEIYRGDRAHWRDVAVPEPPSPYHVPAVDWTTREFVRWDPPPLAEAQAERIAGIKREAYDLLAPFDWYVIRQQEAGESIPLAVANYRAAVRMAADQAEHVVTAMTDTVAILDYTVAWPEAEHST